MKYCGVCEVVTGLTSENKSRRSFLQTTAAAAAGLAVGAVAGYSFAPTKEVAPPGGVTTSTKPNELVIIFWGDPMLQGAKLAGDEFTKQTGIPMKYELESFGAEGLQKISADWPNTPINLWGGMPASCVSAWDAGYLEPMTETDVPNLKNVPDMLKIIRGAKTYGVAFTRSMCSMMYRKDLVPAPITSYHGLLDKSLKGKIGWSTMANFSGGILITAAYANGGDEFNVEPGWEYLKELAPNVGAVCDSDADAIDKISRGDIWVFFQNDPSNIIGALKNGAAVEAVTNPTDSKLWATFQLIIVTDRPGKEYAKQYVNTMLSVDEAVAKACGMAPSVLGAQTDPSIAPYVVPLDELQAKCYIPDPVQQSKMIDAWTKRYETEIVPLIGTG